MIAGEREVPERFLAIRYDPSCYPGSPETRAGFANCQSFAYALLRHFGRSIPDFRSSDLWGDTEHTFAVERFAPLDLILFNHIKAGFGAHVGVFVGRMSVLHLARRVGVPAVWNLRAFVETPAYCVVVGAKRTRK